MKYRRAFLKGGCYFFTVNLADRESKLLVENSDLLRSSFRTVKQRHPFHVDAIVIMPDHLHAIWTLPEGDADFATRWSLIKSGFSRSIPKIETRNESRLWKGERGIWQRRYWEHSIRDDRDFGHHVDYIHYNPVKHGYVNRPVDWPYSSIHRFIENGDLDRDWGANVNIAPSLNFGEA